MEGGPEESAQAVLRAQQARPADDRLLRRERSDAAEGVLLEKHPGAGVRLLVNGRRLRKERERESETVYHGRGLTKESSELRFGDATHIRVKIPLIIINILLMTKVTRNMRSFERP